MAFSGNVPIEAVVSRGVSGVGPVLHVPPNGASVGAEGELRIRQVAVEGQAPQSAPAMVSQLDQGGQVHYVGVRCGGDHEPYVIRDYEVISRNEYDRPRLPRCSVMSCLIQSVT